MDTIRVLRVDLPLIMITAAQRKTKTFLRNATLYYVLDLKQNTTE